MQLIPRVLLVVDHAANAEKAPRVFEQFAGISRFAVKATAIVGLVEEMDGSVYVAYRDILGVTSRVYVENDLHELFTEVQDFAII